MIPTRRVATMLATAAVAASAIAVPATASASSHWTKAECQSWIKSFDKKHPHATSKQKSEANKSLKGWDCSEKV